ncbi:MAG TPA: translation elongation factor Ts [Patescibacteria group bacterium]|nr:translation elongation factor Ts [Patescibacteria group bacterium]
MEKIKQLREKTGAGIVDCKNALQEADNDMDKAVEILRKKGIAKAYKRSDKEANEGVIKVDTNDDHTRGYILEVNSETDFVAKNQDFQDFANKVLELIKQKEPADLEELKSLEMDKGTVQEELDNLSGVIKEKMTLGKFEILEGATVGAYSHMGGKIGVLVSLDQAGQKDLATDVAMHIAASNPKYIKPEDVPQEEVDKEKDVYREELKQEGKPEEIIEKILEGKINKYYEEICLNKQEFIKEEKKKVEEILGEAKVEKFLRYSL